MLRHFLLYTFGLTLGFYVGGGLTWRLFAFVLFFAVLLTALDASPLSDAVQFVLLVAMAVGARIWGRMRPKQIG
jgi:hypothetical protein